MRDHTSGLKRLLEGRSRTSWKLFASFSVIVFAIAAAIGVVTYGYFSATYRERLEDISDRVLENVKRNIDLSVVEKVENIGTDLGMATDRNESIQRFLQESVEDRQSIILSIYNTLSDLIAMHADMLQSISIYSHANRTAVSDTTVTFLSRPEERATPRDISWVRYFDEVTPSRTWTGPETVPSYVGTDRCTVDTVSYVSSLPFSSRGSSRKGLLVVRVRLSFLRSLLEKSTIANAGALFVLDTVGQVLAGTSAGDGIPADILGAAASTDETGKRTRLISKGDESFLVHVEPSDINGWRYAIVVPDSLLVRQSSVLRGTLLLICVLAALLALPVGYVVVMAVFDPVNRLISLLRRYREASHGGQGTPEGALIREMEKYFERSAENYDKTIRENGDAVLSDILKNALDDLTVEEDRIRARLRLLHLEFPYAYFFAAAVAVIGRAAGDGCGFPELLHRRLIGLINRLDIPGMAFIAVSHRQRLIVIVNTAEKEHTPWSRLLMDLVANFARAEQADDYFCGIGSIHGGLSEIHASYRDADAAAQEYFLYYPDGHLFDYATPRSCPDARYALDEATLAACGDSVRRGDRNKLDQTLSALLLDMREAAVSSRECEAVLDTILLRISDAASSLGFNIDAILGYDAIRHSATLSRADLRILWYLEIVDKLAERRSSLDRDGSIESIKAYIRKNISYDLSLQMVADDMALSYGYLSDLFRRHAGMTFIGFVTRTRMEMAEEMLRTTRLSVGEISAKIGYANPSYFIKRFREFANVSPVRYRRLRACLDRT